MSHFVYLSDTAPHPAFLHSPGAIRVGDVYTQEEGSIGQLNPEYLVCAAGLARSKDPVLATSYQHAHRYLLEADLETTSWETDIYGISWRKLHSANVLKIYDTLEANKLLKEELERFSRPELVLEYHYPAVTYLGMRRGYFLPSQFQALHYLFTSSLVPIQKLYVPL